MIITPKYITKALPIFITVIKLDTYLLMLFYKYLYIKKEHK